MYPRPLQCRAALVSCRDRLPQHLDFVCNISDALVWALVHSTSQLEAAPLSPSSSTLGDSFARGAGSLGGAGGVGGSSGMSSMIASSSANAFSASRCDSPLASFVVLSPLPRPLSYPPPWTSPWPSTSPVPLPPQSSTCASSRRCRWSVMVLSARPADCALLRTEVVALSRLRGLPVCALLGWCMPAPALPVVA